MPARIVIHLSLLALLSACANLPAITGTAPTATPEPGAPPTAAPTSTLAPALPVASPDAPDELATRISWGGLTGAVALHPDGTTLAIGTDAGVRLVGLPDGGDLGFYVADAAATQLAWSPDGAELLIWTGQQLMGDQRVLSVDIDAGGTTRTLTPDEALGIAPPDTDQSPDGRWSADGILQAQEAETGTRLTAQTWSPDSQYLAAVSSSWETPSEIFIWRAGDVALLARLNDIPNWYRDLERDIRRDPYGAGFSGVGSLAIAWSDYTDNPIAGLVWSADGSTLVAIKPAQQVVQFWDVRTGRLSGTLGGFRPITAMTWSPDRQMLATVNAGSTYFDAGLQVWRRDGTLLRVLDERAISMTDEPYRVAWSPDGRRLAVLSHLARVPPGIDGVIPSNTGSLAVWRVDDGRPAASVAMSQASLFPSDCLAYSPDGIIAVSSQGAHQIRLFRDSDGVELTPLQGHTGNVNCVTFSPGGDLLASTSEDGTVVLWEWPTQRVRLVIPAGGMLVCGCMAWSADGSTLASVVDDALVVWRTSDGAVQQRMPLASPVTELIWSPDAQYIVACDSDGNLYIWRASDGALVRTISGPRAALYWSADGTTLLGSDGSSLVAIDLDGQLPAPAAAGAEPPRGPELALPTPTVAAPIDDPDWITIPAGGGLAAFRIMRTEVTQADYVRCMNAGVCSAPEVSTFRAHYPAEWQPYWYSRINDSTFANHPIVWISQQQARTYARWKGGRLPTDAEWQRAAQGDDGRAYPWGSAAPDSSRSNFRGVAGDLQVVGSYPAGASPYGVLDLSGNAWEWVAETGILRGGSFMEPADAVRATTRLDCAIPGCVLYDVGFRVVLDGTGGIGGAAP
ncbi:MAG: SUMF1/EgtB/PvdO family nonheme iron enzyme [Chloroflexi bacterium]|nr:SUMF1/EgtB/PvdO family nonheme iron enzyme [Chloroflexota bacterium]